DRGRTPASHFTIGDLVGLWSVIREAVIDPATDGVVVVQGTDTIEETAFCWDLLHDGQKPVVVTGAMRSSSEAGYDGPANLTDAVRAAAAPDLRGEGVTVVLGGTIHAADDVATMHTSSLTAFGSPNLGPLGDIVAGRVAIQRRRAGLRHVVTDVAAEPVFLVTAVTGIDGSLVDAAVGLGARGIVVAATGSGNTSLGLLEAAERAIRTGIPVALATRVPAGRAGTAADVEGIAAPGARRIDLAPDEVALPGLTDAHLHLADAAVAADQLDLADAATHDEALALVRAAHERPAAGEWLRGAGWDA